MDTNERRRRRSTHLHTALNYQLEAVCEEYGLSNVALATDDGFVVSGIGDERVTEWLAALAPAVVESQLSPVQNEAWLEKIAPPFPVDDGFDAVSIDAFGSKMYIAGLASNELAVALGLAHAMIGVHRIFSELRN